MTEADLYSPVLKAASKLGVVLMRNNVGCLPAPGRRGIFHRYGLGPGTSDLIGWRTLSVEGQFVAQIVAIELKVPGRKPTENQQRFLDAVVAAGGLAGCVHSVDEAISLLQTPL